MKNFDALKWLCLLSLLGFIYCFVFDLGYFTLFLDAKSINSEKNSLINLIVENLKHDDIIPYLYISVEAQHLFGTPRHFAILHELAVLFVCLLIS